jgi:signal transduction histidine kinase
LTTGSLRVRLIAAAACAVTLALVVSSVLLVEIFNRHVNARTDAELTNHLNQIIAGLEIGSAQILTLVTEPADPRFSSPNGGLYWQIDRPGRPPLRSRSLWETLLTLPDHHLPDGVIHRHALQGPADSRLYSLERGLSLGSEAEPIPLRLTVALDRREIDSAIADFKTVLMRSLAVVGMTLLIALWVQVQIGLRPLANLRAALDRVHGGTRDRVEGTFPTEVQPLVDNMNALLDRERRTIDRARERAGDLAHGFKTPLTVLSAISRDLTRDGHIETADEIECQIDIMGRHVRRELARARTVGSTSVGRSSVLIAPVLKRVIGALQRIGADRNLRWDLKVDETASFVGDENDLMELIGNIADNAAKWTHSRVAISVHASNGLIISVDDDGPGIPMGAEQDMLARGRRLDEAGDGSGLGLSIVAKIVDAYGGKIILERSALGGLSVNVAFPNI